MNNLPVIAGVEIATDSEGRFNLNMLHKASTEGAEKAPSKWQRNKQAKELIAEVERQTGQICLVSVEGRSGGTFAHELVAVEYAGWISPAFRIQVNQTFLDYRTGKLQPTNLSRLKILEMALDSEKKLIAANSRIEEMKPKVEALDRIATADGSLCVRDAAKNLQIRPKDLTQYLSEKKWIYKRIGVAYWIGYQDKIQQGLLEHKATTVYRDDGSEKTITQARITPKGLTKLAGVFSQEL